jgi:LMBR1 domain-containing protein 1
MVLYQQICLIKGNTVFGIRIPFVLKVHPLVVNKTYMNSLLFNANLMLLASLSTSLLALWAFPTYLGSSSLSIFDSTIISRLPVFSSIYSKRIPMILMVSVLLLTMVITVGQVLWRRYKGKEPAAS